MLRDLLAEAGPAPAAPEREIDAETAAQLRALGYAAGGAPVEVGDELASLEAEGPDASDMVGDVAIMTKSDFGRGQDSAETVQTLVELSARYPESTPVLNKLLDAQLASGQAEEALATLRRGVELDPDNERFWPNLGELLVKMGRRDEAREVLPEVLERFPCDHTSRIHLASFQGDPAARIALLEGGLDGDCEPSAQLDNELAWALATVSDEALRDGPRALELARRAAAELDQDPLVLDTLAVVQLENGDAAEARATLDRARRLARRQGQPAAVMQILDDHAAAIAAGRPIRE